MVHRRQAVRRRHRQEAQPQERSRRPEHADVHEPKLMETTCTFMSEHNTHAYNMCCAHSCTRMCTLFHMPTFTNTYPRCCCDTGIGDKEELEPRDLGEPMPPPFRCPHTHTRTRPASTGKPGLRRFGAVAGYSARLPTRSMHKLRQLTRPCTLSCTGPQCSRRATAPPIVVSASVFPKTVLYLKAEKVGNSGQG
jgi:hypothetical protein